MARVLTRGALGLTISAISALGGLSSSARAQTLVDDPGAATSVSAYGRVAAWSRYVDGRGFVLTVRAAGVIRELPITPRWVPFDVDVGPDDTGKPVLVYSRCRGESILSAGEPLSTGGAGCRLYQFDLQSNRERRLDMGSSTASDVLPSRFRGSIAFVRVTPTGPRVYLRRHGQRKLTLLRGGPAGQKRGRGPTRLDLGETRLALGWQYIAKGHTPAPSETDPRIVRSVRVDDFHGGQRVLQQTTAGRDDRRVALPSLDSRSVYYASGRPGGQGFLRRYTLATGARTNRPAPGNIFAVAAEQGTVLFSELTGVLRPDLSGGCRDATGGPGCALMQLPWP